MCALWLQEFVHVTREAKLLRQEHQRWKEETQDQVNIADIEWETHPLHPRFEKTASGGNAWETRGQWVGKGAAMRGNVVCNYTGRKGTIAVAPGWAAAWQRPQLH